MNKTNQTYIDGSKEAQDRRERLDNARLSGWSNAPDEPATGEGVTPELAQAVARGEITLDPRRQAIAQAIAVTGEGDAPETRELPPIAETDSHQGRMIRANRARRAKRERSTRSQ